ncbi:MAG: hypothetical protein H6760_00795 [Candidatus Nomurabacteria bacterium]|nr:MAG: hypothetical protein H6760_00795 [Candidatus Nomurabacteria bacterium]
MITWWVIFPILILAAVGIIWMIAKMKLSPMKRAGMIVGGIFTFIGFSVVVLGVYYQLSMHFSGTFQIYAYSNFAPNNDPFNEVVGSDGRLLTMQGVKQEDGKVFFVKHPDPDYPTGLFVFTPGKMIVAEEKDNQITIPEDVPGSLSNVTKTSLWWALTKDIYLLESKAS